MTEEQKKKLEQKLWDIANTLRGKMNADEFRDYILGFIFFKYLSERLYIYANSVLEGDNLDFADVDETTDEGKAILDAVSLASIDQLGYFLKPSELFRSVAKRGSMPGNFILEDLSRILSNIERSTMGTESEDDFDDLFSDMDLTSNKLGRTEEAKNTLIAKVLTHLDEIDFELEKADSDVLGDAYEYLIGQFASGAGKKAGEFYTPQEVSTILARIVTTGKTRLRNVYDPTCGSGSLLLRVAKEAEVTDFCGQEMNRTTYNLARMNMILHGIHYRNFDLQQEDTLEHPRHADQRFEAVVANPPFSAKWSSNPLLLSDDRYSQYGRLAPASKADFAFVQHMLHQLDENGTMAVILPHGVLFRGAAEGHIREYIIKDRNWLDAVIGLPANIFYGTSIPTCILVFKKCREHPEDILFMDASTCFEKAKNQNYLRPEDINKIVGMYQRRGIEERFSHRAPLAEVAENDYNLNIPRYVDNSEEEVPIELDQIKTQLRSASELEIEADKAVQRCCASLGIEPPIGSNGPLLGAFKRGIMQKLFSRELRFTGHDGSPFPSWEDKQLSQVLTEHKCKSTGIEPVFSVSVHKGLVNQIEHLGRSFSAKDTSHYNRVKPHDVVYTKSPTGDFPLGIIKQAHIKEDVIVSPLYGVFTPETPELGYFLHIYFESRIAVSKYLSPIVQKGAKNTINVTNTGFLSNKLTLPTSHDEQVLIANALLAMNAKISSIQDHPSQIEAFDINQLRQMFL